jgi:hypothetical protein
VLRLYGVTQVTGDAYARQWVSGRWEGEGFRYKHSDLPASELFLEAQPAFNQGRVSIPNHHRLVGELRNLERKTGRSGRDRVEHPAGLNDDHANALAGCMRLALAKPVDNRAFVVPLRGGF